MWRAFFVEAPGQLPILPIPKSGPGQYGTVRFEITVWYEICWAKSIRFEITV